jgi:chromosome segregation ATPase
MTEETLAAPVAPAEIPATEITEPVVETTEQTEAPPEKDERDKAIARMERRINRKHAEAAEAKAERDFLREQLQKFESQKDPEEPEVDPKHIAREVERRAAQLAEAREFDRQCNEVAATGATKFKDFQSAVNALASELPLFGRDGSPTPAMKVVLEAEKPAALLYHLGKNPDLASELADLTPTQLSRRLDRIEREMATPKTSAAPKPLDPVKATASGSKEPKDMTDAEFAAWRRSQIAKRT